VSDVDSMSFYEDRFRGWQRLVLDNGMIRVSVLPQKGAGIYELVDVSTGTDALFKAPPEGLRARGAPPRVGAGDVEFLQSYEGGWQPLFPNLGSACMHHDKPMPVHGEAALLPWDWTVTARGGDAIVVSMSVRCTRAPLRLTRVLRLPADSPTLTLEETISNESSYEEQFVWGHHCVLGGDFLEQGCRLTTSARLIKTDAIAWEAETARLEAGTVSAWPNAHGRDGVVVDLRSIPGTEAGSHDDVLLTDLTAGVLEVTNPRLRLVFRLAWDAACFPWIRLWQAFGGARRPPLSGSYALGVEPWSAGENLEHAIRNGTACRVPGMGHVTTTISASLASA
jgi:hypothetical protein